MVKPVNKRPFYQRVAIDIAGFAMLAAVPLVGWIPGPGGIPLVLGGLGLLALNHEWAERWLLQFKAKGTSFYEILFPKNKLFYWLYDILGVGLVSGAVYLRYQATRNWLDALSIALIFFGSGLLLANRQRIEHIVSFFKRTKA